MKPIDFLNMILMCL